MPSIVSWRGPRPQSILLTLSKLQRTCLEYGGCKLLDNSMVLLGNGNGDAAKHDHGNWMTLLAGRAAARSAQAAISSTTAWSCRTCGSRSWTGWASKSSATATAPAASPASASSSPSISALRAISAVTTSAANSKRPRLPVLRFSSASVLFFSNSCSFLGSSDERGPRIPLMRASSFWRRLSSIV